MGGLRYLPQSGIPHLPSLLTYLPSWVSHSMNDIHYRFLLISSHMTDGIESSTLSLGCWSRTTQTQ